MTKLLVLFFAIFALPVGAKEITVQDLSHLPISDVIILGEVHDNPVHHENQALAVAAIKPTALVFEMLTPEQAAAITDENRTRKQDLEKALGWAGSGWPDFGLYFPIFEAAPGAAIVGGARPREAVRRAVKEGAAAVFGVGASDYGLTENLPEGQQKNREDYQSEAHCNALPEQLLPGMVQAQRLRDASFADAVIRAFRDFGGPVILITGNGHARTDWGVPAAIARAKPETGVLSVVQFEAAPLDPPSFDLFLITEPAEREDPCAVFQKSDADFDG